MDIKCKCDGTMRPVVLEQFDFTQIAGFPSLLQGPPGLRCDGCGAETVPGEVINISLEKLARALHQMPQLLPGNAARYLRRFMRLSQQELADKMGVNRVTVAKWENGTDTISQQNDLLLRTVLASHLIRLKKPKPAEVQELAKAIEGVRQDTSTPPPFVIDHFLTKLRPTNSLSRR